MRTRTLSIAMTLILCQFVQPTIGQMNEAQNSLEIGKPCPSFLLKDISNYTKNVFSKEDLKGHYTILDFWTTECVSCIESFPKLNKLQNEFKNKAQIILIGRDELGRKGILKAKKVYQRFKEDLHLDLVSAYDTTVFQQFEVPAVPFLIWIDSDGIVKAITSSGELRSENIQSFTTGNKFKYIDKSLYGISQFYNSVDMHKLLFVYGNGGEDTDFLFRSVLAKWDINANKLPFIPSNIIDDKKNGRFQGTALKLSWLYYYAYFGRPFFVFEDSSYGKIFNEVIFEIEDSFKFYENDSFGFKRYAYSLAIPTKLAGRTYFQEIMQRDLANYFGYHVRIEKRMMPCWKLITIKDPRSLLESKSTTPENNHKIHPFNDYQQYSPIGFSIINGPVTNILRAFWAFNPREPAFIDGTGIDYNIDIDFNATMTDIHDIKKSLKKSNLDLVRSEQAMDVLVLCDKP